MQKANNLCVFIRHYRFRKIFQITTTLFGLVKEERDILCSITLQYIFLTYKLPISPTFIDVTQIYCLLFSLTIQISA